jgi:hypothetical protein
VPQLQGVQGRSRIYILRAPGNAEDGAASAFPKGKQNENNFLKNDISSIGEILSSEKHYKNAGYFKMLPLFFILFTII